MSGEEPQSMGGPADSAPLSLPQVGGSMQQADSGGSFGMGRSSGVQPTPRQAHSGQSGLSFGGTAPSASMGFETPFPATSAARRRDLGPASQIRRRSISMPAANYGESDLNSDDMEPDADAAFVWGTTVSVANVEHRIRRFLQNFKEPGASEPKYMELIRQMVADGDYSLNIDCADLQLDNGGDKTLYSQLVTYPTSVIPLFDSEVKFMASQIAADDSEEFDNIQVKVFNLSEMKVIRDLNPADINNLISVSGMVTRTSNIIPDMRMGVFKCDSCGHVEAVVNDMGRIEEPSRCGNGQCNSQWTMKLMHNRSYFNNKQLIKMQENPNAIPEGETPHAVSMFAFDDMVDVAKPGDRITVTGIYKAAPMRISPRLRIMKSIYKTYIDVVHVSMDEQSKLYSVADKAGTRATDDSEEQVERRPFQGNNMSREQEDDRREELEALAADPEIYDKLVASIAPSIWQLEDVKRGILCQLFGGTTKEFSGGRVRGEINVLLVGDPGVSKSQLLSYVHKLAPRGIYTSGRGSSAVGLTAYVTRDPETKEMVLESGALVLSDMGICCIDEFDKMSDSARSMLHEVMEQQTVSVAKAGIISTLNARTSVLACANPVNSRYDPRLSVIDNIQLPPTLISRFDLIYLVLDKANEASDRKLARFLVALNYEHPPQANQALIPLDTLRDYIAYARTRCTPELSDDAAQDLIEGYLAMRKQGISRKVITATPRQLESLIRLSEALARMRLSPTVERPDVAEAIRLMRVALQQSATDPTTGAIDMDKIMTGFSASDRMHQEALATEIRALLAKTSGSLSVEELLRKIRDQSSEHLDRKQIVDALQSLQEDVIYSDGRARHKNAVAA
ncbi:hypothetical protein WJX72_003304 [[Myrmecia] bisecta]|uniref:DNA replication licensing factor MCM4 n=1 Tax=[Myrmecia] bisecta TaxID=41462 RepID=A0AAW1Q465_9CHLO